MMLKLYVYILCYMSGREKPKKQSVTQAHKKNTIIQQRESKLKHLMHNFTA